MPGVYCISLSALVRNCFYAEPAKVARALTEVNNTLFVAGFQQQMFVISLNNKKAKEVYFAILVNYLIIVIEDKKTDIEEGNLITLNNVISSAKRKSSAPLLNKKPLKKPKMNEKQAKTKRGKVRPKKRRKIHYLILNSH